LGTNNKIKNLMNLLSRKNLSILTFILIPILFFLDPLGFSLMQVQPYWPIFWLLPWAIINGPINGLITGLFLGLMMDILINDPYTQIPGLLICGFWFGNFGKYHSKDINRFQYGLISSLGSFLCGITYFVQIVVFNLFEKNNFMYLSLGIKNIFAQVFLTGLLAPIFCAWLFALFNKKTK